MSDTATDYHPWSTFLAARAEADRIGAHQIGTDLLLIALLREPEVAEVVGITPQQARESLDALDREALVAFGYRDTPAPQRYVERPIPARPSIRVVVKNRLKMSPNAKRALEQTRQGPRRRPSYAALRAVSALLENAEPDPAAVLLGSMGVDRAQLRSRLEERIG
ncbi:MAG TPA: Clp protease N-terminal domain-containing protein [Acidimicrobiales bacterium]|nr:Clp protease N-terminal domain-containing protein [Acidimicrobiales bacterium]